MTIFAAVRGIHRLYRTRYLLRGALSLVVFLAYSAGSTLFTHVHTDELSGERIVHSHPYSGNNPSNPGHTHTGHEWDFIYQLSHTPFLSAELLEWSPASYRVELPENSTPCEAIVSADARWISLRAPPVFFS